MLLPIISFKADWANIIQGKKNQIYKDNLCENNKQLEYMYKVGDQVFAHYCTRQGAYLSATSASSTARDRSWDRLLGQNQFQIREA